MTTDNRANGRDPLLPAIKRAYEEMDPVPEGLSERVLVALALDDLDLQYELLTLVHRSEQLTGVRGPTAEKTVVEFTAEGLTVMLRISPASGNARRIDGWVTAAAQVAADPALLSVSLVHEGSAIEAPVSGHGRFEFDNVPRGLIRLDVLVGGDGDRSTAFRTTLFEI